MNDRRFMAAATLLAAQIRTTGVHLSQPIVSQVFDLAELAVKEDDRREALERSGGGPSGLAAASEAEGSAMREQISLLEAQAKDAKAFCESSDARRIQAERDVEHLLQKLASSRTDLESATAEIASLRNELKQSVDQVAALKAKVDQLGKGKSK
jgi:chromosome segregation ATPase